MPRSSRAGRALLAVPMLFVVGGRASATVPSPVTSGPAVTLSKAEVDPGDHLSLTIGGFVSPYVTISVCGNEARRGSVDCNMTSTQGIENTTDATPITLTMQITEPPADCPCVVRVVGQDVSEVAVTPINILGHPIGPLVDPPVIGDLVKVSINARESPQGALDAIRADLGGAVRYEVTVRIKNTTTSALKQVKASASAARSGDDSVATLAFADPGLIGVGQTWSQTVATKLSAPSFGAIEWRVTVSGAGPIVDATQSTHKRPFLLVVLLLVVVFNVFVLLIRLRIRRRAHREARKALETPAAKDAVIDATSSETLDAGDVHEDLVGASR